MGHASVSTRKKWFTSTDLQPIKGQFLMESAIETAGI